MTGLLPDFLVIGAMKAGTTSLYEYLRRHPEVGMSREKETDFLIEEFNWKRGLDWYRGQFTPGRRIYGEVSPNYSKKQAFPGVPERAAELLPQARIVFIVREPVERANSQYCHAVLSGAEVPPVEALLGSHEFEHLIDTSSYASQLVPWIRLFARERILILEFEEFVSDPAAVLSRLADFLGIRDEWPETGTLAANSGDSLARLPIWLFRLRDSGVGRWLKGRISPDLRNQAKGLLRTSGRRTAEGLTPALRLEMARRLADDVARFREISGLDLRGWPGA